MMKVLLGFKMQIPTPHDSPLHSVHSHGSDEGRMQLNELTDLVKKLKKQVKTRKARRRAKIVLSDDEAIADDSSKQGRKRSDIDEDLNIFLAHDEGVTWVQDADTEVQEKQSDETKLIIQEETPTEIVEDHGSRERMKKKLLLQLIRLITAGEIDTAADKPKDKGKAIMIEPEPQKKSKKLLEQERLDQGDPSHVIDWNDPSVLRYHALKSKPISISQARKNMITYLKNQGNYNINDFKGMSYEDIRPIFEKFLEIVPIEEIAINAIPLALKPPMIVDVEVISEGKKIVKGKYKGASPEENYKRVLWGDLKVMFEPDMESTVWKMLENYDVTAWILYSSCGVHLVKFKNLHIFLLVDKIYPLTHATITKMLDRKLQAEEQNEMGYQLLKLMLK
ncbi:hypothetical protein Tco_0145677 [Tanacetum coccineum]